MSIDSGLIDDGDDFTEQQPEVISSFLHFDNAQVGSIVVDSAAELICVYNNVFGGGVRPDLDIADAYFRDGHRLALVVTPRFDDNDSMSLEIGETTTGDIDPRDPDAEPNCFEFSIKLMDAEETDAAMEDDFAEADALDAVFGEEGNGDDKVLGDETMTDQEGPCHRVALIALPEGIEYVAIWVIPPGENPDSVDDDMLLQDLPGTYTLALGTPAALKRGGDGAAPGQHLQ